MTTFIKPPNNRPSYYNQTPIADKQFRLPRHIVQEAAKDPRDKNTALIHKDTKQVFFFVADKGYCISPFTPDYKDKIPALVIKKDMSLWQRIRGTICRTNRWKKYIRKESPVFILTDFAKGYSFPLYSGDGIVDRKKCELICTVGKEGMIIEIKPTTPTP